jgi:hypothetical protein
VLFCLSNANCRVRFLARPFFDKLNALEGEMTIFTFALGIVFVVAGLGGIGASINLVPTELGLLYAECGAMGIATGGVIVAIAALIHRLGKLRVAVERAQPREAWQIPGAPPLGDVAAREIEPADFETAAPASFAPIPRVFDDETPAEGEPGGAPPLEEEDAVNTNRVGHLPTMSEIEHALAEPEPAPTLVGRYSAGGANYMIFSDGSIEAETEDGAFKFGSMSEFKAYLAGSKRA